MYDMTPWWVRFLETFGISGVIILISSLVIAESVASILYKHSCQHPVAKAGRALRIIACALIIIIVKVLI